MSKWYEVKVTTTKVIAVEVNDDEDSDGAMTIAEEEAPLSGTNEIEVTGGPYYEGEDLERLRRHADEEFGL